MNLSYKRKFKAHAIALCSLLIFFPLTSWSAPGESDSRIDGDTLNTAATIFGINQARAATDQASDSTTMHNQEIVDLLQSGGMDWGAVRKGVEGSTVVRGQETNELIQAGGQDWREIRNELISTYGLWWLAVILVALSLFYIVMGQVRLEQPAGIKILRWTLFERILHWFVGTLFIILALSGISLLWGRPVLIPLLGKENFSAYAEVAKFLHNYLALLFIAGLLVMLFTWLRQSLFVKADLDWFRKFGGYFGGPHVSTGKVNAGEKMWYWSLFVAGIALSITGLFMLFPNFGWERETIQISNIIHSVSGIFLIGFAFLHIYLGTIGNEGALEGMVSGKVDAGWGQQHHDLWYKAMSKK